MYEGSRHQEIAATLSGLGEPQPQRLPGAPSLPAHDLGRGEANSGLGRGNQSSEQRLPRPRPSYRRSA